MRTLWRMLVAVTAAVTMTGCAVAPIAVLPSISDIPVPWQRSEPQAAGPGYDDVGLPTPAPQPAEDPPPAEDPVPRTPAATRPVTQAPPTQLPQTQAPQTQVARPAQPPQTQQPIQAAPAPQGEVPITIPPTQEPPRPTRNDCQPEHLQVSFGADPAASRATYSAYLIWMTNTSPIPCEIAGFPGVDFALNAGGQQVGRDGVWDETYDRQRFSLAPGQRAAAEVRIVHASQLVDCFPAQASYLKVIAPNTWVAYLFPLSVSACTNPEVKQLSVRVSRKVG